MRYKIEFAFSFESYILFQVKNGSLDPLFYILASADAHFQCSMAK